MAVAFVALSANFAVAIQYPSSAAELEPTSLVFFVERLVEHLDRHMPLKKRELGFEHFTKESFVFDDAINAETHISRGREVKGFKNVFISNVERKTVTVREAVPSFQRLGFENVPGKFILGGNFSRKWVTPVSEPFAGRSPAIQGSNLYCEPARTVPDDGCVFGLNVGTRLIASDFTRDSNTSVSRSGSLGGGPSSPAGEDQTEKDRTEPNRIDIQRYSRQPITFADYFDRAPLSTQVTILAICGFLTVGLITLGIWIVYFGPAFWEIRATGGLIICLGIGVYLGALKLAIP